MADIPITQFGIENVEKAYKEMKTSALMECTIGLTSAIAVFLIVRRFMSLYNEARKDGKPDIRHMTDIIYQYAVYVCIILALPFIIYFIEAILGQTQVALIKALGGEPKGAISTLVSEIEEMQQRYPEGPSLFDSIPDIFAYFNIMYVKPFLAWIVRYLYAMALSGRYLYLLLLEIMAPVAIVMMMDKETIGHFHSWTKHMIVCYLMIPAFILANALGDKIVITLFDDPYALIAILASFFVKLYLLGQAKNLVFKLI